MKNPLTEFRKARGLSVTQAAIALDVSQPYISQLEGGYRRPGVKILTRLAALGVDVAAFIADYNNYVSIKRVAVLAGVVGAENAGPASGPELR